MASGAPAPASAAAAAAASRIPRLPPTSVRSKAGWAAFEDGIHTILTRWDLLKSAVLEEWGGPASKDKAVRITSDLLMNIVEQWRDGNDLHEDTLDDYFITCLESDFNVDFEDDTCITQVSLVIQDFYRKCADGDLSAARDLIASLDSHAQLSGKTLPHAEEEEEGDEGVEEESDEETPAAAAASSARGPRHVVDEDGWETVVPVSKRKGGAAAPVAAAARASSAAAGSAPPAGGADETPAPTRDATGKAPPSTE